LEHAHEVVREGLRVGHDSLDQVHARDEKDVRVVDLVDRIGVAECREVGMRVRNGAGVEERVAGHD
jgi:hypothetical protein